VLGQLVELFLRIFNLIPIELKSLALLAYFGPMANVLDGDPQLRLLVAAQVLALVRRGPFGHLADHLLDQLLGFLVAGVCAILPAGRLPELVRTPFRVLRLPARSLAVRVIRLRFFLLALLGAALAGLLARGLQVGDHLAHHLPLLLAVLQVGREDLHRGLGGYRDHPGLYRSPSRVHELERRADVLQRERLELRGGDRYAIVRGVSGEGIFDLPLEEDRHIFVGEPGRNLGRLRLLSRNLLLSLVLAHIYYFCI